MDDALDIFEPLPVDGPLGGAEAENPPWTESYKLMKVAFALFGMSLEMANTYLIELFEGKDLPWFRVSPIVINLLFTASILCSLAEWSNAREEGWIRVLWPNGHRNDLFNFLGATSVVFPVLRLGGCIIRMVHRVKAYSEANLLIALLLWCFAIRESFHGMLDVFALLNIGLEIMDTCLILLFEEKGSGIRVSPILITLMSITSTFYSLLELLNAREKGWVRVHPFLPIYQRRNGLFFRILLIAPSVVFSVLRLGCCITRMVHRLKGYSEVDLFIAVLCGGLAIFEAFNGIVRRYLTRRRRA